MGSPDADGPRLQTVLAEINVTPLVDVMLVLLIIFMVTAPMLTQGVPIDLPETRSGTLKEGDKVLILEIDSNQDLYLLDHTMTIEELSSRLPAIMENRSNKKLFVRSDRTVPYGFVVKVLSAARNAGVVDVGLVTEPSPEADDFKP